MPFLVNLKILGVAKHTNCGMACEHSGRGAVRLARLHGVQEVEGSNPFAPTKKPPQGVFSFAGRSSPLRDGINSFPPTNNPPQGRFFVSFPFFKFFFF